jgi:hypothetical protein
VFASDLAQKAKDGERRRMTETSGNDTVRLHLAQMREEGELGLPFEPRCRVCRNPDVRKEVNRLLSRGFTFSAILATLKSVNAALPPKARVSRDSLYKHARLHFNMQAPAGAIYRQIQERRAAESGADFESGIATLVNARSYLETMMVRGYETLIDEGTVVTVGQGAYAAKQLAKMEKESAGAEQMAQLHAQLNRVVRVITEVVPENLHQQIMDILEGREAPALAGAKGAQEVDEFNPGDDEDFDGEDREDG